MAQETGMKRARETAMEAYKAARRLKRESEGKPTSIMPPELRGEEGLRLWLTEHARTLDEVDAAVKRLPDLDFLHYIAARVTEAKRTGRTLHMWKSRRLVVSWLMACIVAWECCQRRETVLYLAPTQDRAQDYVWRVWQVYEYARQLSPELALPELEYWGSPEKRKLTEIAFPNGSRVKAATAFSARSEAAADSIRGEGASIIVLEELSTYVDIPGTLAQAAAVCQGAPGSAGGRIVSISNASNKADWRQLCDVEPGTDRDDAPHGVRSFLNASGSEVLRIHYSADPGKRSPEWKAEQQAKGVSGKEWRREFELDQTVYAGVPVFEYEFRDEVHVPWEFRGKPMPLVPGSQYFVGLDCGTSSPRIVACLVQLTPRNQAQVLGELVARPGSSMATFAPQMLRWLQREMRVPASSCKFGGDRTVTTRQGATGASSYDVARSYGVAIQPLSNMVEPRINAVSLLLDDWVSQEGDEADWVPRLVVCGHTCPVLVEALRGGYQYESVRGELSGKPVKDKFSDAIDALSSAALMINPLIRQATRETALTPHDEEWWNPGGREEPDDLW